MTINEALLDLYKGTVNVKKTADALGVPLGELQQRFREFVATMPIDEDVWKGDVDLSWPYIT